MCLKKAGERTHQLIGYNQEQLRLHLQSKFEDDMNWDNYGRVWQIDHYRPVASFDFDCDRTAAIRECWSLSNLRPLLNSANLQKGSTWNGFKWRKGKSIYAVEYSDS
jgi:hypothetical protein